MEHRSPCIRIRRSSISNDDYSQFQRLVRRGERVSIEADIKNTITRDELMQVNTVAEIRGSDKPDEVVLLGAHLDSWDLATGGTDNGTGSIAVLEAARILKAAGARPPRTIRFVLFSGEEEGLLGSQAYAEAHDKELGEGAGRARARQRHRPHHRRWRCRGATSFATCGRR